jgi:iron complex transport system ATP-binding protein
MANAPIVVASDLVLAYGDHVAVAASDFEIPAGAVTAVIGPNGSGKSTILNAIAGLAKPAAGEIVVRSRHGRAGVAYVFQATKVNESMPVTVHEVVAMGRYARLGPFGPFREPDRAICRASMARLDIQGLANQHLDELSGGQRQRVFVAQGLAQGAELLLLDEPITGLDLLSKETILSVVRDESDRGTTVVMSTHDLGEAAAADHVLLLSGRVVASGPPSEVLTAEHLSEAYRVRLVSREGALVVDDPHHLGVGGRHIHLHRHPH